jgi:hypothetical protein
MNQPEPNPGRVPVRLFVVIGIALLMTIFAVSYTLYTSLGGERPQLFPVVHDYLQQPQTVPERVAVISPQVRRIEITHAGIEAYTLEGQRYSINPDGTHARRDDMSELPTQSFAVGDVDFTKLPLILAAATEHSGGTATSATVEVLDGEPMWLIATSAEGEAHELLYTLDGQLRPAADAR